MSKTDFGIGNGSYDRSGIARAQVRVAGQYDHPVEVRRLNRHGFVVITYHYSAMSERYALAEEL